jgi:hypothetical protein
VSHSTNRKKIELAIYQYTVKGNMTDYKTYDDNAGLNADCPDLSTLVCGDVFEKAFHFQTSSLSVEICDR